MALIFTKASSRFSIAIDNDKFLDLLDSESYVTSNAAYQGDNETLCQKLGRLSGVFDVDYNGHFGAAVHLTIDTDSDKPELRDEIRATIRDHLDWCGSLEKASWVVEQRAKGEVDA